MRAFIVGLILGLVSLTAPLVAQDHPTPVPTWTDEERNEFNETHIIYSERALFGIQYYLGGREIDGGKPMQNLLSSIDDEETLRQWRSGEDQASLAWILMGTGSGAVVAGGLFSWQGASSTSALGNVLVITGLSVDLIGGLFWRVAQSQQLSAVDRYNSIVRQENGFSLLELKCRVPEVAWVENF
jgi:hypothetical protein